jgi:DNA-directed RNA polymerase beta subunit
MEPENLTREQAKRILRMDLKNILEKVKNGKTLSAAERRIFEEYSDAEVSPHLETVQTLSQMADRLGVALRTVSRWKKKYPDCPKRLVVSEWIAFREAMGGENAMKQSSEWAQRRTEADARRAEKQVEKLELEIDQIKRDLVHRNSVRSSGARLATIIRSAFARLERDLSSRLEGKTPEERRVEIRHAVADVMNGVREELEKAGTVESIENQ